MMMLKQFKLELSKLLGTEGEALVFNSLEEQTCAQAVRIIQGAIASAPVMGWRVLEVAVERALKRFSIMEEVTKRRLCEVALVNTYRDFFQVGEKLFLQKLGPIKAKIDEEVEAQAKREELAKQKAEAEAKLKADIEAKTLGTDKDAFAELKAKQQAEEAKRPAATTEEERLAETERKNKEAFERAKARLQKKS